MAAAKTPAVQPGQPEPATGATVAAPHETAGGPALVWDMPGQVPPPETAVDESLPHPSAPRPAPPAGHIILATVEPVATVTLPPLEQGGETVVITREGTAVDEATAARAYEATAGHALREIKPSA